LSSAEVRWIDVIFTAIFPDPPRSPIPVTMSSLRPAEFYARLCREARWDHALTLRAAVWATAVFAPLVVLGRLATVTMLDESAREALLVGMAKSRHYLLRQLAFLLKAQAGQVYCAHEAVRRRLTETRPSTSSSSTSTSTDLGFGGSNDLVSLRTKPTVIATETTKGGRREHAA
jgi:hypothetical protein